MRVLLEIVKLQAVKIVVIRSSPLRGPMRVSTAFRWQFVDCTQEPDRRDTPSCRDVSIIAVLDYKRKSLR